MRKGRLILIGTLLGLHTGFAFQDSDLDGVEDSVDKCPNTPILELVDRYGCPLESKLGPRGKFYLRVGGSYTKDREEERAFSLISVAFSYGKLYTSFSTRYYLSSKLYPSGMGDSRLFVGYSGFIRDRMYTLAGIRFKIPTGSKYYSNGKVDFTPSVLVDYIMNRYDLFTSLSYTFRGDNELKNTFSISLGGGYEFTEKLYGSLSLDLSQSALNNSRYNTYLSMFALYDITRNLYTSVTYSAGLNRRATDHSLSVRLGIRF